MGHWGSAGRLASEGRRGAPLKSGRGVLLPCLVVRLPGHTFFGTPPERREGAVRFAFFLFFICAQGCSSTVMGPICDAGESKPAHRHCNIVRVTLLAWGKGPHMHIGCSLKGNFVNAALTLLRHLSSAFRPNARNLIQNKGESGWLST
ncbi:hypothetical protein NDU88_001894 [Pleurodeles waltl]|uniref:Uncharacterized protein n=1 Tax=Pleurodeles waltl TaxID=8319 RepID=A0AAV7W093_PLEWA|nr:hypothetical protein NDU88_001894 [Pleurodeles waltl]